MLRFFFHKEIFAKISSILVKNKKSMEKMRYLRIILTFPAITWPKPPQAGYNPNRLRA